LQSLRHGKTFNRQDGKLLILAPGWKGNGAARISAWTEIDAPLPERLESSDFPTQAKTWLEWATRPFYSAQQIRAIGMLRLRVEIARAIFAALLSMTDGTAVADFPTQAKTGLEWGTRLRYPVFKLSGGAGDPSLRLKNGSGRDDAHQSAGRMRRERSQPRL
jgi:hypothetical protein